MMEWMVVCESELVRGKEIGGKTSVTHINVGPVLEYLSSA